MNIRNEIGSYQRNISIDKQMSYKGRMLYIHSLDRSGQSKAETLQEWNTITE